MMNSSWGWPALVSQKGIVHNHAIAGRDEWSFVFPRIIWAMFGAYASVLERSHPASRTKTSNLSSSIINSYPAANAGVAFSEAFRRAPSGKFQDHRGSIFLFLNYGVFFRGSGPGEGFPKGQPKNGKPKESDRNPPCTN